MDMEEIKGDSPKRSKEFDAGLFADLLRAGMGMRTQSQFAEDVGLSKIYLNRIMNGHRTTPLRIETIRSIAEAIEDKAIVRELYRVSGYPYPGTSDNEFTPLRMVKGGGNKESFAEALKICQGTRTQKEFAKATGLSLGHLTLLINGKFEGPIRIATVHKIAAATRDHDLRQRLYEAAGYRKDGSDSPIEEANGNTVSPDRNFDARLLAETLKRAQGLRTQAQFAAEAGISVSQMSKFVTGKLESLPQLRTINKIASAIESPDLVKALYEAAGFPGYHREVLRKRS